MASSQPEQGATETGKFKVRATDLASSISPYSTDVYPDVLATSRIVAFMEIVASRLLVPYLGPGQLSVGVTVNVTHSAPTPIDEEVKITAEFVEKNGKLFVFNIVASDAGGEVGKARHERAVVDKDRIMGGARKRSANANLV